MLSLTLQTKYNHIFIYDSLLLVGFWAPSCSVPPSRHSSSIIPLVKRAAFITTTGSKAIWAKAHSKEERLSSNFCSNVTVIILVLWWHELQTCSSQNIFNRRKNQSHLVTHSLCPQFTRKSCSEIPYIQFFLKPFLRI